MAIKSRADIKALFQTGDKPTQADFIDLIDSLFSLMDDSGAKVRDLLEALADSAKLTKRSVRGAEFAINKRGSGNLYDSDFKNGMVNILQGDFWVMAGIGTSDDDSNMVIDDWCIAAKNNPSKTNYGDTNEWIIAPFGTLLATASHAPALPMEADAIVATLEAADEFLHAEFLYRSDESELVEDSLSRHDNFLDSEIVEMNTGTEIDFNAAGGIFVKSLTENTTFTFANPVMNKRVVLLLATNGFTVTLPGPCYKDTAFASDEQHYVEIHCLGVSPALYWAKISIDN